VNNLRDIKAEDRDMIYKWRNLPEVAKYAIRIIAEKLIIGSGK